MGRLRAERDPRRSLLIGGLVAGVVLAVLFLLLIIGVIQVFSVRQDPIGLGPATESLASVGVGPPFA